jgi:EAL domain-containing protein (putative c-di-GMP-specific phosphodiesterase class I)
MDHDMAERLTLHGELADGIGSGELRLLFQPVFDLEDGTLRSAEALVRWEHPRLGLLTPDRFISLAESTGLIEPLGSWVLHEACRVAATWPEDVGIAVNISPRQLDDDRAVDAVRHALASTGVAPSRLVLEITESVLARDPAAMVPRLEALHDLGVRIAVDDFGTGYSSLSVLVELPVDILKIDRTFIARMLERPSARDLVQVLIEMGRTLGLDVVAEGIEEVEQALALRQQRCQFGQGFLYARPLPVHDFAQLLEPVPQA